MATPATTRHCRLLRAIPLSLFSGPLYQDVARRWKGAGLLYLLLVLALCWMALAVAMHVRLGRIIAEEAAPIVAQVPPVKISNGQVSIGAPEPHIITSPKTGKPLIILDTTGQYSSLEDTEAAVLLTGKQLLVRRDRASVTQFDLPPGGDLYVDRARATLLMALVRKWFAVVFCPVALALSFAYRVVQALLYALIGGLLTRAYRCRLPYVVRMRLAIVAVTPAILFDTILGLTGGSIPYWRLVCFLLAMGYLAYGVKVNATPEQGETGPVYRIDVNAN